jgi:membrane protein
MIQYIRSVILPSKLVQLLIQTGVKWNRDDCSGMAAALSFHALFSLFPFLLVVLSVIGALVGPDTEVFASLTIELRQFLPPDVQGLVRETVVALNQSSLGAGIIGFGLLIYSASTVFSVLQFSVSKIWRSPDSPPPPTSIHMTVLTFVLGKLWSLLLPFATALLLLTSLLAGFLIQFTLEAVTQFQETFAFIRIDELQLAKSLQIGFSFLILALVFCILFKSLPPVRVKWRDVWLASLLTAFLIVCLQQLIGNSVIRIGGQFQSYGVIGSVMILLLWINFTCQIFFAGCEFSYIYAHLFGSYQRISRSRQKRE